MNDLLNFFTALLAGVLVGTERQWKARNFPDGTYVAGLRTFSLIGAFGGLGGILSVKLSPLFGIASFLAVLTFVAISYYRDSNGKDRGLTTEFGALGVFFSSLLCGIGALQVGIVSAVTIFTFLSLKKELHLFVKQLGEKDIFAILKFLVLIAIIFPVIPNKNIFPNIHFNPSEIFKMVILISGLSLVGYVFVRLYGAKKGVLASAFFGSLVSSTAITVTISKYYRENTSQETLWRGAILLGCGVMFVRLFFISFVLNPPLSLKLFSPFFISAAFLGLVSFIWIRSEPKENEAEYFDIKNPANISTALKFGLLLGVVFLAGDFARDYFGDKGLLVLSFLSGISDADAITITLSKISLGAEKNEVYSTGIFIAATVNTLVKGLISMYAGGFKFGVKIFGFLSISVVAGWLSFSVMG